MKQSGLGENEASKLKPGGQFMIAYVSTPSQTDWLRELQNHETLRDSVLICGLVTYDAWPGTKINDDYAVSTGSGSDRVSIHATVEGQDKNPVATALGTDLIIQLHLQLRS